MYDFLKDKTALYIEDELDVLKNISELLSHFFDEFYTASNGEQGYQKFLDHKVDVLLVDIELPKMNGIELIRKVRQTHKDLPIIVISAYTRTDYLLDSIELKLDQYIVKPLTSKRIHEFLEKLDKTFWDKSMLTLDLGVYIDTHKHVLTFDGEENTLSKRELEFLLILAQNKMIHYDEIDALWEDTIPTQNAVRSFIKQLRKKLPEDLLKNRNGFGYLLNEHT
jgi:DNA-binding response OmpR family regulator